MLPILAAIAVAQEPVASAPVDTPLHAGSGPHLTGYLQVWGTVWDMDEDPQADPATYGDPEDDVGFKLRRVRIGLDGTQSGIDYVVTIGTEARYDALGPATETIGLEDALVVAHPYEQAAVTIGLQKVPVGREQLISSTELAVSERAVLSEWLVPGRDVGVTGEWTMGAPRFRVGIYNGNGSILGDDNLGMLFAARLELAAGTQARWDDVYETWGTVERTTFGVALDAYDDLDLATNELGAGVDAILRTGGLAVLVEGRMERLAPADTSVDVPAVPATTTRAGALAQVGCTLGDWEPALRGSWFDDATALEDNGDTAELTAGFTWHSRTDALRVGAGLRRAPRARGRAARQRHRAPLAPARALTTPEKRSGPRLLAGRSRIRLLPRFSQGSAGVPSEGDGWKVNERRSGPEPRPSGDGGAVPSGPESRRDAGRRGSGWPVWTSIRTPPMPMTTPTSGAGARGRASAGFENPRRCGEGGGCEGDLGRHGGSPFSVTPVLT